MKDPIRTISRYLDDDLPDGELQQLIQWIEASEENAALFAKVSQFDSDLRDELGLLSKLPPPQESPESIAADMVLFPEEGASSNDRYRRWGAIAALIAVSLLVLWQLFPEQDPPQPQEVAPNTIVQQPIGQPAEDKPAAAEPVVAMITRSKQADQRYSQGVTLKPGHFTLEQGSVEIQMLRGALVILQAPCRFELIDDNQLYLTKGKLTADVPEDARYFTVQTPSMTLVDLGTRFGADVHDDGSVTAAVFEGEIIAHENTPDGDTPDTQAASHSLKTGDAIHATPEDGIDATVSKLAPDHDFQPTWRDLIGQVQVTGQARFFVEPPADIGPNGLTDPNIIVFQEKTAELDQDVQVWTTLKKTANQPVKTIIPAGSKVVSYMLVFSPGLEQGTATAAATLTFPGKVVGALSTHGVLARTNDLLGMDDVRYVKDDERSYNHEIDLGINNDYFQITGQDQNNLEINLTVGRHSDQVRVLILAPVTN